MQGTLFELRDDNSATVSKKVVDFVKEARQEAVVK